MIGTERALLFLLLPLAAVADAHDLPGGQDPAIAQSPVVDAADTKLLPFDETDTRLTVPVAVGSAGPYNFIIDTGAERTVVSRELAGALGLAAGAPITLTSMTERSQVGTVIVPQLQIQSIGKLHTIIAPALDRRNIGAAGLLGIDTLADHKVAIDFETGIMSVSKSERRTARPVDSEEIVVTARSRYGQLIVTDAFYGTTRIQVVLDTGAQVSMGNLAFYRRVARKTKDMQFIRLTSVTGGHTDAQYTLVPDVKVGNVQFDFLPVAFADAVPFRRFGLTKRPAILLGMDALRSFRHVEIDFPNRQVRFRMFKPNSRPELLR
jgi:predicted aspartyl protease